ncbi:glucosidase 2 subunit beta-like isoform X3 [Periophthalmus magnuspinnatus]|uniref:glucosidase 2 subunit beta-like isoform X3 n=1 Tax=Periophthalmus magnuspinnatus TaxID=409849 RepID=UPI00243652CB|nr:glucosidase 2 subunit beta-like isoform X3 [Periophthalmus magnuspinnatus]
MNSKVMTENWHTFLRFIFKMRFHIVVAAVFWSDLVDSRKIRGISSSYKRFYREKKSFLCIDGSKMIPFEQVNDDYCDCQDGSDEPGTSACPRGRFYCTNLGFRPHYIPSSRVNDGICDCCDASDEYNSPARCQNSCWNLGQRERAFVEGQMRALDEGLRLKQQLIEEGVLLWREKQAQLRDLQQVAEDLQIKLQEHRRKKNEAEQALKALQSIDGGHTRYNSSAVELFNLLDSNKDGSLSVEEIQSKVTFIQDEQRVLTEDEAVIKETHAAGAGRSVGEDPHLKAADRAAEWEATNLKKAEESYERVNAEISELQRKLAIDYGTDWEFLFLNSQCFQLQVYEYTYTLCPFNQVTQRSAAGTEVSLGVWGMWSGSAQNVYSQQVYENGEPCWQGGSRSTTVTLTCGTETGLRTAKEPSKCQYIMDLQTPVACQPVLKQRGVHSEL